LIDQLVDVVGLVEAAGFDLDQGGAGDQVRAPAARKQCRRHCDEAVGA
jgi:hypothetical protein